MTLALPLLLILCPGLAAQQSQPAAVPGNDEMVRIDLPSEGVELRTLADIVTKRLGIPILYDEAIANKKVVVRVPRDVPASSLLGVLQSALRMKGFMLVDAAQPGWKQIVPAPEGAGAPPGAVQAPAELQTNVYHLKNITPERLDRLIQAILPEPARHGYQSMPDRESQSLVVAATPPVHRQIEQLISQLDIAPTAEKSPVRFYKLRNTKAADVLATIQDLLGHSETTSGNAGPMQPGAESISGDTGASNAPAVRSASPYSMPPFNARLPIVGVAPAYPTGPTSQPSSPGGVHTGDATVTADPNTNSIIVIAPPAVQQTYADLIQRLDIRRPQVQIECTLVTLDTSDNYSFGVDISKAGGFDVNRILSFSSFGISSLDPQTGQLTPVNGRGGTFAVLGPDITNVVLRALAQNSRSRLVSAPQLLVNDNGHGQLKSVAEQPYAELLTTVGNPTQTSFGGYAQAGTTIDVEPHISDGDYMQLSYAVELSNFTGVARNNLPPPSQRNQVQSTVTIPDGSTIVVGGLSLKNLTGAEDTIPLINQIPPLRWIFGTHSGGTTETTLFVFIRPTILRDDQFQDLKYLSDRKAAAAGVEGSYPSSGPIPLH